MNDKYIKILEEMLVTDFTNVPKNFPDKEKWCNAIGKANKTDIKRTYILYSALYNIAKSHKVFGIYRTIVKNNLTITKTANNRLTIIYPINNLFDSGNSEVVSKKDFLDYCNSRKLKIKRKYERFF